ncbi:MAG: hypothetical protein V3U67_07530 [Gemmatimonadota bacterium]
MSIAILALLIIFVCGPIARAVANRIGAGTKARLTDPEQLGVEQLQRLREEVTELQGRVTDLADKQEFTTRLLEAGSSAASDFTEDTGK